MYFHFIYYPLYILTMQVYHDYGRMPDSDQKIWLRSYILTPIALTDSGRHHNFRCLSWLRLRIMTPVNEHALSYHLSCERLCMAGLYDCSILQPGHLVGNRLGGTHDSINVQNIRSHSFACRSSQTMCHTTKEHLACHDLRKIWVYGGTRYPTTLKDQGLWIFGQAST
jgi:hypothetical protein